MCGLDGRVASFWRCIYIISIYIYTYVYYDLKGIRVKWYEMMWWNDLKAIDLWQGNHWPPGWMFVSRRTEHKRWLHRWISSLPSLLTQVRRLGRLLWLSFDDGLRCLRCGEITVSIKRATVKNWKTSGMIPRIRPQPLPIFRCLDSFTWRVYWWRKNRPALLQESDSWVVEWNSAINGVILSAHFETRVNLKSIDFVSTGINSLGFVLWQFHRTDTRWQKNKRMHKS